MASSRLQRMGNFRFRGNRNFQLPEEDVNLNVALGECCNTPPPVQAAKASTRRLTVLGPLEAG